MYILYTVFFYSLSGRKGRSRFFFNPSIFNFSLYAIDSLWETLQVSPVYQSLSLQWNSLSRKQQSAVLSVSKICCK